MLHKKEQKSGVHSKLDIASGFISDLQTLSRKEQSDFVQIVSRINQGRLKKNIKLRLIAS